LVDERSVESRLERLGALLAELEGIRGSGRDAYDASFGVRLATQHALQLAIQSCIDIAGHLAADSGEAAPDRYADYFNALREDGLDHSLADRLELAVGLRNILVHDYLDIDENIIWRALDHLDDLRDFAAFVVKRLG
jgi:uncharacterized protein YutE (UPF0331/DUF86 family)